MGTTPTHHGAIGAKKLKKNKKSHIPIRVVFENKRAFDTGNVFATRVLLSEVSGAKIAGLHGSSLGSKGTLGNIKADSGQVKHASIRLPVLIVAVGQV